VRRSRLGLKLTTRSRRTSRGSVTDPKFGLSDLVDFRYDLAVGGQELDPGELAELARLKGPAGPAARPVGGTRRPAAPATSRTRPSYPHHTLEGRGKPTRSSRLAHNQRICSTRRDHSINPGTRAESALGVVSAVDATR
jgi:SNF2 Helicase protein